MRQIVNLSVLVGLVLLPFTTFGSVVSPSDKDYYSVNLPKANLDLIFPAEWQGELPWISDFGQKVFAYYSDNFGQHIDEKTSLLLASSHNQISNAFATMYPYSSSVFYPGVALAPDTFAVKSWIADLFFHEVGHLFQLNPKQGLAKLSHKIFGNNVVNFLPIPLPLKPVTTFPLPVINTPTGVLPTWILEGNAVFNESRFGNGGRLFSGDTWALFYLLLGSGVLDETRLTNNHLDWPYTREKYLVGGIFNLYLAERFGTETLNHYFRQHAYHFWNPLRVNKSFQEHFGLSYSQAIIDFLQSYQEKVARFKTLQDKLPVLAESKFFSPLSKQDGMIRFLASDTGYGYPTLWELSDKGQVRLSRAMDLKLDGGRIFKANNHYYSASSSLVERKKTLAGLWGESLTRIEKFDNWAVQDLQTSGPKVEWLAMKVDKSLHAPLLYKNGSFVAESNSSAIFNHQGQAIYFVQVPGKRILKIDQHSVFEVEGYYAKPLEVDENGNIYFIAATEMGTGLFVFKKRTSEIYRLSDSDAIVDARLVNDGRFVIVEMTNQGFRYLLSSMSEKKQAVRSPHFYFEQEKPFKLFQDQIYTRSSAVEKPQSSSKENSMTKYVAPSLGKISHYNELREMRFSSWMMQYYNDGKGGHAALNLYMADPLLYNEVLYTGMFRRDIKEDKHFLTYQNERFLLKYGLSFRYEDVAKSTVRAAGTKNLYLSLLRLGMHVYRYHDWDLYAEAGLGASNRADGKNNNFVDYQMLKLERVKNFGLNLYPHRLFRLKAERSKEKDLKISTYSFQSAYGFNGQHFIDLDTHYKESNDDILDVGESILTNQKVVSYSPLALRNNRGRGQTLKALRLGMDAKTIIPLSYYHRWIPFGIRRIAPKLIGNYYKLGPSLQLSDKEYGTGIDVETLIAHLAPVVVSFSFLHSSNIEVGNTYMLNVNFSHF